MASTPPSPGHQDPSVWMTDLVTSSANLLLTANWLIGAHADAASTPEARQWHTRYNDELLQMAVLASACTKHQYDERACARRLFSISTALSQLRRGVTARLRAARLPMRNDATDTCSFAVVDAARVTLRFAATVSNDLEERTRLRAVASVPPGRPGLVEEARVTATLVEEGMRELGKLLEACAAVYMDASTITDTQRHLGMTLLGCTGNANVWRVVGEAMTMQVLVGIFDCTRLAAGARINESVFGDALGPVHPDVARAEVGRADAYAVVRLYEGLRLVVALMMMGTAKRAEHNGDRNAWLATPEGRAVLAFRARVATVMRAYDTDKRLAAERRGRTYVVQTPGYVAMLQEQVAELAVSAHNGPLLEALSLGLGQARLFTLRTPGMPAGDDTDDGGGDDSDADGAATRVTFWEAVGGVADARERMWMGEAHRAVAPVGISTLQTVAGLVFGLVADARMDGVAVAVATAAGSRRTLLPLVMPTKAMREAMDEAARAWPAVMRFFGRDWIETERKVSAKALREGRDPSGREVGEQLGYRQEWMAYLTSGAPRTHPGRAASVDVVRQEAGITTLATVEALTRDTVDRPLPLVSGGAVHVLHCCASAAMHSGHRLGRGSVVLLDASVQERVRTLLDANSSGNANDSSEGTVGDPLAQMRAFSDGVIDHVGSTFKGLTGGLLVTEQLHAFYSEVWRRFNHNLQQDDSAYAEKLARWRAHYAEGTAPTRTGQEAKLIHPWRFMRLQQGVAAALLNEWHSETEVLKMDDSDTRLAMRVQRALLHSLNAHFDYAPWASHIIRRFCPAEDRKVSLSKRSREESGGFVAAGVAKENEDEHGPEDTGAPVSPSLARVRA